MAASDSTVKPKAKSRKDDKGPVKVIKNAVDLQRLKLEKLMNNPNKEVVIPDQSKDKAPRPPLEFIRNIWGSSAGAGSGDFHVYRGVRRREYARQKYIKAKAEKEELDDEYKKKLEQHKKEAEERTNKNRAKRLKKKQKMKAKRVKKSKTETDKPLSDGDAESGSSDDDEVIPEPQKHIRKDTSAKESSEHEDAE